MYLFIKNILSLIILSLCLLITSCNFNEQDPLIIDFTKTLNHENQLTHLDSLHPIHVAVGAMISPKETFSYYEELFDYISKKTNRSLQFKQRKTYKEVNDMLTKNEVDFAFICSGAYVDIDKDVDLLVAPVCENKPYYQAYILAHKDSDIETFKDFRNKTFAYTDPLSNTGKLYAEKRIKELNTTNESFFSKTLYSHAHDVSIQLVSKKMVDGATIDGLIYEYLKKTTPDKVVNIKVIEKSEYYGMPPIVTSKIIDNATKENFKEILLNMHSDTAGLRILNKLMIDRFEIVGDTIYNSIRDMQQFVKE